MIYLDSAATTMIKPAAVESAVVRAMRTMASPGRGAHKPAMRASDTVFECRQAAAELFSVDEPDKIIFTMNATHALNIAINSLAQKGTRVLVSGYEHNSVTRPLTQLGANIIIASSKPFDTDAILADFEKKIPKAKLVVCTHVSNVFGFILPIYEIAALCRKNGVPLIVDASQSAGSLEVNQQKLRADFIAMPGHKGLFGPQGTGILIASSAGKPFMSGGSGADSMLQTMPDYLPDRYEAGTHNVCGIAGLLEGIRYVSANGAENIGRHEAELAQMLGGMIKDTDGLEVFMGAPGTQSGVLSVRSSKIECGEFASALGDRGICVRSGLHCSPYAHKSAGTINTGTVRFSFSPFVSRKEAEICADVVKELLRRSN